MNFKHPPGPPMDLANMRRQGVQLRTTPIIHEVASLAIINVLRDAYPGLAYASMTASTYKGQGSWEADAESPSLD
jgi:hypothetical protein